jgi:hypothetical protein
MGKAGTTLIWSPQSNRALYGESTNIPLALKHGVSASLGIDWNPSGSDNIFTKFLRSIVAVAIALCPVVATATSPITLDSRVLIGAAPAWFRVRITLEPDARNRYLCLQWQQIRSGNAQKIGCWSVDAEREPRTMWKDIKDLAAGKYVVVAYVIRNDEQRSISNPVTLTVTGIGYEPDPEE